MHGRAIIATALVSLALPAAAPGAAKKAPLRCKALRGTTELVTGSVKVVRRKTSDGLIQLRGCARPNGIVRTIGTQEDAGLGSSSIRARSANLTWVKVDTKFSNQYGGASSSGLFDVRTGRAYMAFSNHYDLGAPVDRGLNRLLFDSRGRSVTGTAKPTKFGTGGTPTAYDETITVFAPDGTGFAVDSGPQAELPFASLTLENGTATWTHSGATRTVVFA
jgi:hypothetical protein